MIRDFFKNKPLRSRLILTLIVVLIYRIGGTIPVPFLDTTSIKEWFNSSDNGYLQLMNIFSGGMLQKSTIFALSVSTYINAQIIIQLLTHAIPPMEKWKDEGLQGKRKLDAVTKASTLVLSVIQSIGYYLVLKNQANAVRYTEGFSGILCMLTIIMTFIIGCCIILYLADWITARGLGNGVSILLFVGIVSRLPNSVESLVSLIKTAEVKNIITSVVIIVTALLMLLLIVFVDSSERKIPIRYAQARSNQAVSQTSYFPVKLNMSGVMPIIFASMFLYLPQQINLFVKADEESWFGRFNSWFYSSWVYCAVFIVFIVLFNMFYTSLTYDPTEIANNLRKSNAQIIGIRPGKPTADYFLAVFKRMMIYGSAFLGLIAVFPIVFQNTSGVSLAISGTSILILVNVALELKKNIASQLVVRNHQGFLRNASAKRYKRIRA